MKALFAAEQSGQLAIPTKHPRNGSVLGTDSDTTVQLDSPDRERDDSDSVRFGRLKAVALYVRCIGLAMLWTRLSRCPLGWDQRLGVCLGDLDAGTGFEPVTFRL